MQTGTDNGSPVKQRPRTRPGVTDRGPASPAERPSLQPEMTTGEAVRVVSRWLLATIRAEEGGVLGGDDPEHLHDFRVAVRRTRSLLSELRGAFQEGPTEHFLGEFKWLGRCTGPIRDLDVWIEKQPRYRARLPTQDAADLVAFESRLRLRRDVERARLVRALRSARYASLLEEWEEFLWRPAIGGASRDTSDRPISDVASERIWKAYCKALEQGRKVEPASPPAELHKLRIRCKRLRYLLEFFGSLYAADAISESIDELKTLQDHLGDSNDFAVQRRLLPELAREITTDDRQDQAKAAVGRLEAALEAAQKEERDLTEQRFDHFQREKNRRMFKELFAPA